MATPSPKTPPRAGPGSRFLGFGFLIVPPRNASSGQARTRVSPSLSVDTGVEAAVAGRKADTGLADVDR
jgi:hypothetical protein